MKSYNSLEVFEGVVMGLGLIIGWILVIYAISMIIYGIFY